MEEGHTKLGGKWKNKKVVQKRDVPVLLLQPYSWSVEVSQGQPQKWCWISLCGNGQMDYEIVDKGENSIHVRFLKF